MDASNLRNVSLVNVFTPERDRVFADYILPLLMRAARKGYYEITITSRDIPRSVAEDMFEYLYTLGYKIESNSYQIKIIWR